MVISLVKRLIGFSPMKRGLLLILLTMKPSVTVMNNMSNQKINRSKFMFGVTSTDRIVQSELGDEFINSCINAHGIITKIIVTCYRAAGALTEMVLINEHGATFVITIDLGVFSPAGLELTDKDIQTGHKQITLLDTTDILILTTRMARRSGLKPVFPEQSEFSSILEFTVD